MANILVVDDAQTARELMGRVLTSLGHVVAFATDGADALPTAKEVRPDLVLMDIVMPRMDGFRAMRTLKDDPSTSAIPVVLVSTKNNESDIFWGKKQGAADYLPKPFTEQSLIATVCRILGLSPPASMPRAAAPAMPAAGGALPTGVQAALDALSKELCKATGPFGKMTFKTELGKLGIPPEHLTRGHLSVLVSGLASTISDMGKRREFEAAAARLI